MKRQSGPLKNEILPISNSTDIDRIRRIIIANIRDLLLFDLAIETGVPAKQLLLLKVKDLLGFDIGERISSLSGKQQRDEPVVMGPLTYESFREYLRIKQPGQDDLLFKSRKGGGQLSVPSASRLVSSWFDRAGMKQMSGFLSLRKTWEFNRTLSKPEDPPSSQDELPYAVKEIQTLTTQELVYKELEQAIVTARIKPGEKLVAEKLAKQMGTSRIPVREALGRLEARNFLTVQPKKGTTVNELSEKNLNEILEIRLMLELCAARKAAISATKETVSNLEKLNRRYVSAQKKKDANQTLSINREFHFSIYRVAKMPILLSMIRNLWDQVSPYYHLMFRQTVSHDPQTGHTYHQKMIDGIAANDPEKVSKWLKFDLVDSTEFVIGVMRLMRDN
jgi:DNA-binding GntR family transcriptional regulator